MSVKPAAGPSGSGAGGSRANGHAGPSGGGMFDSAPISKLSMQIWNMIGKAKNKSMAEAQIAAAINQGGKAKVPSKEIQTALVDLLKRQFLKSDKTETGARIFVWRSKDGADSLEANTPEMKACWGHIRQAGNKGTTAKAIRMKIGQDRITPTAIRRALDALVRAKQVKIFKSIQHPTMQLYVLFDTVPDEGMTGGIWYDGNKEYDSAFVTAITRVLLTYVRSKSWASNDKRPEAKRLIENPLYIPGRGPSLPSPRELLKHCEASKIVNAQLSLKNIMECMRALELDGLVEVVKPTYHVADGSDDEYQPPPSKRIKTDVDSDEEDRKAEMKRAKEKEKLKRKAEAKKAKEKEKKKKEKEKAKKKKEKKRKEKEKKRKEKKKKKRGDESESDIESDDPLVDINELSDEEGAPKKSKKRKRSKTVSSSSSGSESDSSSDSSSDSDSDSDSSISSIDSDDIDNVVFDTHDLDDINEENRPLEPTETDTILQRLDVHNSAFGYTNLTSLDDPKVVYRAIRKVKYPLSQDQVPCGKCPQFSFCDKGGPVNPDNCVYYEDYLADVHGGWDADGKARFRPELIAAQKAEAEAARLAMNGNGTHGHPDLEDLNEDDEMGDSQVQSSGKCLRI